MIRVRDGSIPKRIRSDAEVIIDLKNAFDKKSILARIAGYAYTRPESLAA
ncbi:hypothetical protein RHAL1_03722 [Beijerinckiaceae bacterium RH AL1]|nr:hypothetical protein RHCH11_RHCH11_03652 [Beijerinckiaceae bacterium RH CH11]VVB49303.1 hypothetical protein RHAL8_03648 [Beijerinckiaceae bacterium RH AL8]VVC56791.1 hypothetical protein RHAL1_03722 [Beijerinckiaceae bacterium RH AL1]